MQYTGLGKCSPSDPPTYACVGDQDGIASWRVMKARLDALSALGIDTEFHVYEGLSHGFGLGTGTSAEGWMDDAIAFWSRQANGIIMPARLADRGVRHGRQSHLESETQYADRQSCLSAYFSCHLRQKTVK